ncbi:MAG: iron chelate uptake ABC transporter family permease subunit, partial [Gemmobacter sp.]
MKLLAALGALVTALFAASLAIGPAGAAFWQGGEAASLILREIRLPRAVLGAMIGAALGLAGAAMQGYLRNPLAEPGLIGVSPAAALGAVVALQSGLAAAHVLILPAMA